MRNSNRLCATGARSGDEPRPRRMVAAGSSPSARSSRARRPMRRHQDANRRRRPIPPPSRRWSPSPGSPRPRPPMPSSPRSTARDSSSRPAMPPARARATHQADRRDLRGLAPHHRPVPVGERPGQGDRLEDRVEAGPGRGTDRAEGHERPHRVGPDDRRAARQTERPRGPRCKALIKAMDGLASPLQTRSIIDGHAAQPRRSHPSAIVDADRHRRCRRADRRQPIATGATGP